MESGCGHPMVRGSRQRALRSLLNRIELQGCFSNSSQALEDDMMGSHGLLAVRHLICSIIRGSTQGSSPFSPNINCGVMRIRSTGPPK